MDKLLKDLLPTRQPFALLGGPLLGEEIAAGKYGNAYAGVSTVPAQKILTELFADTTVTLNVTTDLRAIAWAGVLKNIYAVIVGLAAGLDLGKNSEGVIVAKALGEIKKILVWRKIPPSALLSPALVGDLWATASSTGSDNRAAGIALAQA